MKPGLSGSGGESAFSTVHLTCSQTARKSVPFLNVDVWSKELLWAITKSGKTQQEHSPDKVGPKVPRLFTTQAHELCHGTSRALEQNWCV